VVVAQRVSWPDQLILRCTLATLEETMAEAKVRLTALILVGPMLEPDRARNSRLYDAAYSHRFRRGRP
jgi:precorrin-4/cobalt-precorrin-4 C11-methyltransferase